MSRVLELLSMLLVLASELRSGGRYRVVLQRACAPLAQTARPFYRLLVRSDNTATQRIKPGVELY